MQVKHAASRACSKVSASRALAAQPKRYWLSQSAKLPSHSANVAATRLSNMRASPFEEYDRNLTVICISRTVQRGRG